MSTNQARHRLQLNSYRLHRTGYRICWPGVHPQGRRTRSKPRSTQCVYRRGKRHACSWPQKRWRRERGETRDEGSCESHSTEGISYELMVQKKEAGGARREGLANWRVRIDETGDGMCDGGLYTCASAGWPEMGRFCGMRCGKRLLACRSAWLPPWNMINSPCPKGKTRARTRLAH